MIVRRVQVLAVALLVCIGGVAQKPSVPPSPQTDVQTQAQVAEAQVKAPPHEMTAADVEAFLDGFVPMQLERENIAGAVVSVVKDGKVLFAKGYGYADVEKKKPVSVDGTLFRPGSISKLFTWTAVMQLVEQGKLDLDRDVNAYLDFKIPATWPQPITLRNILTHTAGFEETVKELFVPEDSKLVPLKDYLPKHIPERIFPPGTTPAYSNYAATLAGYIVERTSGRPFNDYVAENIFKPLGMAHSTFVQPLPAELKPLMSSGYTVGSGKPKPFELLIPAPAGSLAATAADLSRFMIAHLQNGKFEDAKILRPETAQAMHARQAALSPEMNAMTLGFYEESRNGHRIIGHGGDTIYFHSDLHLVLDSGVGFYVSYNSAGKGEISPRSALWHHFMDRYYPFTPPESAPVATAAADAAALSGYYMSTRRSDSTFLKATDVFGEVHVTGGPDGILTIQPFKDFNGETKKWKEISPMLFRSVNGQDRIAFVRDKDGRLVLTANFPAVVFQRASWVNSTPLNRFLSTGSLAVMALTLLFWPAAALIRRHYRIRLELAPQQRRLRLLVRLVCVADIVFALGILLTVSGDDPTGLLSGKLDARLLLLQGIGALGALGALAVIYAAVRSWQEQGLWLWAKVWNLLVMMASLGFAWFAIHWNLLNFNMNY
ncbi:MAG TPA: serine hydrolase domain-containing protein [Candidatus Solibacter sp.]|nr:serine hydrolase domain-containing protein [Candidatus Solibacter sp.]